MTLFGSNVGQQYRLSFSDHGRGLSLVALIDKTMQEGGRKGGHHNGMGSFVMSHDQSKCLDRALLEKLRSHCRKGGHHNGMGSFVMSHDQTKCLDRAS